MYILLVNQLSPAYAEHRVQGWGRLGRAVGVHHDGARSRASSLSTAVSLVQIDDNHASFGIENKTILVGVVFLDSLSSVLRVALFAVAVRASAWLALALGSCAFITIVIYAFIDHWFFKEEDESLRWYESESIAFGLVEALIAVVASCFLLVCRGFDSKSKRLRHMFTLRCHGACGRV